jgi:hypothetical protein
LTPWITQLVETVPTRALWLTVRPFPPMNQIAAVPLLLSRQRMSLKPSAL